MLVDTRDFTVFRDKYSTQGHILFVPKEETWDKLEKCYKAPYAGVMIGPKTDIVMHTTLDKTLVQKQDKLLCTHVHLIPRRKGDMEDPKGGVRGVIEKQKKYNQRRSKTT